MKEKGNISANFLNIALLAYETNAEIHLHIFLQKTEYFLYTIEKKCRDDRTPDLKPIFLCDFLLMAAEIEPKLD